jgi:hypothetical protein
VTEIQPLVSTPGALETPCVWNVLNTPPRSTHLNGHQVKATLVRRPPMPEQPDASHASDVALFSPAHRLQPAAAHTRAPSLDLHERHSTTSPDDQIDIVTPQPEAMGLDTPAAGRQIGDGHALAFEAEQLPRILPVGDRGEPAGYGHTPRYTKRLCTENRPAAARARKSRPAK